MGRTSSAALLCLALLAGGCPTLVGTPCGRACEETTVVAVYATEPGYPVMPAVALYLAADPYSKGGVRVSDRAPAGFTAFQLEFTRPLEGESIDPLHNAQETLAFAPAIELGSACTASDQLRLIDVDGSGSVPAGTVIPSSVCYDPSTTIGGSPHLTLVAGASDVPEQVFTCQQFAWAPRLALDHGYAIEIGSAIIGSDGFGVRTPTGAGWQSRTYFFRTAAGLQLLAAGTIDQATGALAFFAKPSLGFLKDVDVVPGYAQPADASPLYLFFSEPLALSPGAVARVARSDGTTFPVSFDITSFGDARVLAIRPLVAWEPTVRYTVTLDPSLRSAAGASLADVAPLSFKAGAARARVIGSTPADGALAVAADAPLELRFQSPIDPASIASATISLQTGGADVPFDVQPPAAAENFQILRLVPRQRLLPGARYTVAAAGLLTNPVAPAELAGTTVDAFSASFTAARFRLAQLQAGANPTSIASTQNQPPTLVANGLLTVVFDDAASGVDAGTLHLERVFPDGTATDLGAQVSQLSPSSFAVKAGAPLAPGARYRVRADQAIKNPLGYPVTREQCQAGDCADELDFAVESLGVSFAVLDAAAGVLEWRTTLPADAASIAGLPTPAAPKGGLVRLFRVGANAYDLTELAIACDPPAATFTSVRCAALQPLVANAQHVATAVFPRSAPLEVAATLQDATGSYPVDRAAGQFSGAATLAFTSACAPSP